MAQTILVTGSTSGFGRLIVETLAHQGHTVFAGMRGIADKNAQAASELQTLAESQHLPLHIVEIDVNGDASVAHAVDSVIKATGRLDVVVNNAGISFMGPIESFTLEQVQQQFDTNVFGAIRVNRAALPHMRAQGSGLLLQVGSVAGRIAFPFVGLYGATKFAIEGLTESYRYELAPLGIDAVVVEPGTYPTNISTNRREPADAERVAPYGAAMTDFFPRFMSELMSSTPPNPQEVADAVAELIALPMGKRPLRTVVAPASQRQAPQEINAAAEEATRAYIEGLGILSQSTPS